MRGKHKLETRLKISQAMLGHKVSKETRLKTGRSLMGDKNPSWRGGIYVNDKRSYSNILNHSRRTNLRGTFTSREWEELKKSFNYICLSCKKQEPSIKLTIDHIIPVSKGGSNKLENIQPLCLSCNQIKGVKIISFGKVELVFSS